MSQWICAASCRSCCARRVTITTFATRTRSSRTLPRASRSTWRSPAAARFPPVHRRPGRGRRKRPDRRIDGPPVQALRRGGRSRRQGAGRRVRHVGRLLVMGIIVLMIFRLAGFYFGTINEPAESDGLTRRSPRPNSSEASSRPIADADPTCSTADSASPVHAALACVSIDCLSRRIAFLPS